MAFPQIAPRAAAAEEIETEEIETNAAKALSGVGGAGA
jgi:hypothetical protein